MKKKKYTSTILLVLACSLLSFTLGYCSASHPTTPTSIQTPSPTTRETEKPHSMSTELGGWLYPAKTGDPACSAMTDIADGRIITVLKPQYYTLQDDGTLSLITSGCNSYSPTNVALIKKYSQRQYVTISGTIDGMHTLATTPAQLATFISTLQTFLTTSGFTGVELDVEDFASWSQSEYAEYVSVVTQLGTALHRSSHQLLIDGPAISNMQEQKSYYNNVWKYDDFNALPVDQVVVMAYDYDFDQGSGTPVEPLVWLRNICTWMKSKITDPNKIVIGLPTYGYVGKTGSYTITRKTYSQLAQEPGFSTATRDASSSEMMWSSGSISYVYSDQQSIDAKLKVVQDAGFAASIWHIGGGNPWPSAYKSGATTGSTTSATPPPATTIPTDVTAFFAEYPKALTWFEQWYATLP